MGAVCGCARAISAISEPAPIVGCEVPSIPAEQIPTPESVESSRPRENNKRVEEARRARVQWLESLRRNCRNEEEFQTARTQPIWTELDSSSSCASSSCTPQGPSPAALQRIHEENRLHFQHLVDTQASDRPIQELSKLEPSLFYVNFCERLEAGKKIGGGSQANIHEAIYDGKVLEWCVLKVFGSDHLLADLQHIWTKDATKSCILWDHVTWKLRNCCGIKHGTLLQNGQFAFILQRCWGDLRKALDFQIVEDITHHSPPFPLTTTVSIMTSIAIGMKFLHDKGIVHRDLKAANCLLVHDPKVRFPNYNSCLVADFESSEGVVGTRFWRAPEVLLALKDKERDLNTSQKLWTEKTDVYNYAMTCYEVLTGCVPFEDCGANYYDGVIFGERPPMPDYVNPELQELVRECWSHKPSMRPWIVSEIQRIENYAFII